MDGRVERTVVVLTGAGGPLGHRVGAAIDGCDVVLADSPTVPTVSVRAYNHLLGESGVSFVAAPALAAACRRGFPRSLDGRPMLLPTENMALRRSLDPTH